MLSVTAPMSAPTTAKRKPKATAPATGAISIKDAFGKGNAADERLSKETATAKSQAATESQEDTQDQMDLS